MAGADRDRTASRDSWAGVLGPSWEVCWVSGFAPARILGFGFRPATELGFRVSPCRRSWVSGFGGDGGETPSGGECVGQLEAFWAFKKSQGGEILGTATKSLRLGIYGEPSAAHLVPFATGFVPMADAEPAAEQLVTLQCGERTLETLDWESVLRTQGEDFWDDARFLAGARRPGKTTLNFVSSLP